MRYFYAAILFFLLYNTTALSQLSNVHYLPPLKQVASNGSGAGVIQNGLDFVSIDAIRQQAIYLSAPPESGNVTVDVFQGASMTEWLSICLLYTSPSPRDA